MYDLNDANQTFELTQPVPAPGAGRGAAGFGDVAALVTQAAALVLQPQAAVSEACT